MQNHCGCVELGTTSLGISLSTATFSTRVRCNYFLSYLFIFYSREYSMVLVIKPTSSLAKKTVEQAGLNRQPGLTLLQIQREEQSYPNPSGDFQMCPKDHLQFTGVIDSILSLTQLDGLALSEDEVINP
jgi:Trk K+ transport system NAD-binding subunit